ncbi:MAG: LamG-like jellyroll fold domain-containing protein [Planctomycetota bacterium]
MSKRPHRLTAILLVLGATVSITRLSWPHDTEWPPAADAYSHHTDPSKSVPPNPELQLPGIVITWPSEVQGLLDGLHFHHQGDWSYWPVSFTAGDADGRDDGDVQLVIRAPYHFLIVGDLDIDWESDTGTFDTRWIWTEPLPEPPDGDLPHGASVLIWDVDGDKQNEIVFAHHSESFGYGKAFIKVLRTVPGENAYVEVAESRWPDQVWVNCNDGYGVYMNICNMTGEESARHILTYNNQGEPMIWEVNGSHVELLFAHRCGEHQHALNAYDVDGDGIDEIGLNGIVDFRDVGPNGEFIDLDDPDHGPPCTPYEPMDGIHLWYAVTSGHADQCVLADFDPLNPEGEVMAVPEYSEDILFRLDGSIIHSGNAPCIHGQNITAGNFAEDVTGLEAICAPKGGGCWGSESNIDRTSTYVKAADGTVLAFDGADWYWYSGFPTHPRAAGPLSRCHQIDFDSNRSQDEILNPSAWYDTWYVWRLAKKADLPDPKPEWYPDCPPRWWDPDLGDYWEWGYYNLACTGQDDVYLYDYYYEKLVEDRVATAQGTYQDRALISYDVGRDWREEILVLTRDDLTVYYNDEPNPSAPAHSSPRYSYDYQLGVNRRGLYPGPPTHFDQLAPVPAGDVALLSLPLDYSTTGVAGELPLGPPGDFEWVPGVSGAAIVLGEGDALRFVITELALDDGSFECWVRPTWQYGEPPDDNSLNVLLDWSFDGTANQGGIVFKKHKRIQFSTQVAGESSAVIHELDETWDGNAWHHVAATWGSATGMRLYVDGVLVGRDDWLAPIYLPWDFSIGNSRLGSEDHSVGAAVDAVFINGYPRSPLQVAQDAAAPLPLLRVSCEQGLAGQQGEGGSAEGPLPTVRGRVESGLRIDPRDWFGGTNHITYPADGNIRAEKGTLQIWVKPGWAWVPGGQLGTNTVFHWWADDQNQVQIAFLNKRRLTFSWQSGGITTKIGCLLNATWDGLTWHHIAMTWDTTGEATGGEPALSAFVDGEPLGSETLTAIPNLGSTFAIGVNRNGVLALSGAIDGLVIFDTVRSPEQIEADFKLRSTLSLGP